MIFNKTMIEQRGGRQLADTEFPSAISKVCEGECLVALQQTEQESAIRNIASCNDWLQSLDDTHAGFYIVSDQFMKEYKEPET